MIEDIFKTLHEAVKKRNTPDSFIPAKTPNSRDVIHRGYLRKTDIPIKYDFVPNGKLTNSGIHVYNFKNKGVRAILSITHDVKPPSKTGHETTSRVSFEMMGEPATEHPIQMYRDFILPAFNHHVQSHRPEIVILEPDFHYAEDMLRRLGSDYDTRQKTTKEGNIFIGTKKLDSKIKRIISSVKKSLNNNNTGEKNENRSRSI